MSIEIAIAIGGRTFKLTKIINMMSMKVVQFQHGATMAAPWYHLLTQSVNERWVEEN